MVKVIGGIATREPIPLFLVGLAPSSLSDLSWTDPALGVQDCAWWPEEDQSPTLQQFERYGDETLTLDPERRVVIVARAVVPWSAEEIAEYQDAEAERIRREIDIERDRRIDAGFEFEGVRYQSRPGDRENIAGKALEAFMAIIDGVQPGDLRWAHTGRDFAWIAADNSLVPMDAQTVVAFGKAASAHKEAHVFAARQIKDMQPVPQDYTDDQWWPA